MKSKYYLTQADAEFLMEEAQKYAIEHNFKVSIAIVDETSSLLMMKRLDGASPLSSHLCLEKAKCSSISGRPSKFYEELLQSGRLGFLSMPSAQGMLEGGKPIIYDGQVLGAIGVSGVQSFEDAEIARHAIDTFLKKQNS
ncbi:heme-binding protein [Acinetobacter pittii]|uniref:GlcG/HbpS family heme-binding protein n=1 Tax=Acinetobacter pittii TaxID=48296 RepID=UPI002A59A0D1|nr:heme-binding protein [Acinetobacter pittii]MDY0762448.1 heme-binding protein [Acinetobacter pittii]WPP67672.1 heme-binding protein [Acinetobacter pittii]